MLMAGRFGTLLVVIPFLALLGAGCSAIRPSQKAVMGNREASLPTVSTVAENTGAASSEPNATATLVAATQQASGGSATPRPLARTPTAEPLYGCPQVPCPSNLEYAVNGCLCAGQLYDESRVHAAFCCSSGFSDEECAEALRDDVLRASVFGRTQGEIESQLVWAELQGWPVQVHRKAAAAFEEVARAIESSSYRIVEPVESYSFRNVEGRLVLSTHAYGIAVDINPSSNPSCGVTRACRCYNDLITDMPPEFVQAFKDAGFAWGGDWVEHPDPMHFEWEGWLRGLMAGADEPESSSSH